MPRVNIYVRKDDWEYWQMIDDVPEFIHRAIIREHTEDAIMVRDHIVREGRELGILKDESEPKKEIPLPEYRQSMAYCKEGHPIPGGRSRCMGKGCKYS